MSFLFYGPAAVIAILIPRFKPLMVVISGGIGAVLPVFAFRAALPTLWSGLQIGLYSLTLNLALDMVFLVPMTEHTFAAYLGDIGLRYLPIPITAIAMGIVAHKKADL